MFHPSSISLAERGISGELPARPPPCGTRYKHASTFVAAFLVRRTLGRVFSPHLMPSKKSLPFRTDSIYLAEREGFDLASQPSSHGRWARAAERHWRSRSNQSLHQRNRA